MRNGYLLPTEGTLKSIEEQIQSRSVQLMALIQISVHKNVQVTLGSDSEQVVHQVVLFRHAGILF